MTHLARLLVLALVAMATPDSLTAQWIHHLTQGIPRTADGKADLKAPAPRTADGRSDLSGMWGWQPGKYMSALWVEDHGPTHLQPWALELVKQRAEHQMKDDPANVDCVPQGPRMNTFAPIPVKFVQTPGLLIILSEDMSYRHAGRGVAERANEAETSSAEAGRSFGSGSRQRRIVRSTRGPSSGIKVAGAVDGCDSRWRCSVSASRASNGGLPVNSS
jgi:hypothetical protein